MAGTLFWNSCENTGVTDGTGVSTGNSDDNGAGTAMATSIGAGSSITYSTAQFSHGAMSHKFMHAGGVGTFLQRTIDLCDVIAARFYIRWDGNVALTSADNILTIRDSTQGVVSIYNWSNDLRVSDLNGTLSGTTWSGGANPSISGNTWYRIEVIVNKGTTTTNGRLRVGLYAGDSTTAIATIDKTDANTGTNQFNYIRFGRTGNFATTATYWIDDYAWQDDVTGFIGPYSVPNELPVVSAGVDQTVNTSTTVTLTGSATDSDGTISTTSWTQISGTTVTLSGTGATRTFTAPASPETLVFRYSATDDDGATVTDDVTITVVSGSAPTSAVTHWNSLEGIAVGAVGSSNMDDGGEHDFSLLGSTGVQWSVVSDPVAHGTKALQFVAGSGISAQAYWAVNSTNVASRVYIYLTAYPPSGSYQHLMTHVGAGGTISRMYLAYTGSIGIQSGMAGVTAGSSGSNLIPLNTWVRIEMRTKIGPNGIDGEVEGGWAIGDGALAWTLATTTVNNQTDPVSNVQFGRINGSTYDLTMQMDDFALNTQASGLIGPWQSSYSAAPVVVANQTVEPLETVTLTAYSGSGTWSQTSGTAVSLSGSGAEVTFTSPASLTTGDLVFAYGTASTTVTVLNATEAFWNGTAWTAARLIRDEVLGGSGSYDGAVFDSASFDV